MLCRRHGPLRSGAIPLPVPTGTPALLINTSQCSLLSSRRGGETALVFGNRPGRCPHCGGHGGAIIASQGSSIRLLIDPQAVRLATPRIASHTTSSPTWADYVRMCLGGWWVVAIVLGSAVERAPRRSASPSRDDGDYGGVAAVIARSGGSGRSASRVCFPAVPATILVPGREMLKATGGWLPWSSYRSFTMITTGRRARLVADGCARALPLEQSCRAVSHGRSRARHGRVHYGAANRTRGAGAPPSANSLHQLGSSSASRPRTLALAPDEPCLSARWAAICSRLLADGHGEPNVPRRLAWPPARVALGSPTYYFWAGRPGRTRSVNGRWRENCSCCWPETRFARPPLQQPPDRRLAGVQGTRSAYCRVGAGHDRRRRSC